MPPEVLASDAERERTVSALRHHSAAGRLDAAELEERVGAALSARTRADLEALTADLPSIRRPRSRRARRSGLRSRLAAVAPLAALLITIWALTGAGYFWPVWPILGVLVFGGGHCGSFLRPTGRASSPRATRQVAA